MAREKPDYLIEALGTWKDTGRYTSEVFAVIDRYADEAVHAERERCAKIVAHEIAMGIYGGLDQIKTDAMEERMLEKIRSGE